MKSKIKFNEVEKIAYITHINARVIKINNYNKYDLLIKTYKKRSIKPQH